MSHLILHQDHVDQLRKNVQLFNVMKYCRSLGSKKLGLVQSRRPSELESRPAFRSSMELRNPVDCVKHVRERYRREWRMLERGRASPSTTIQFQSLKGGLPMCMCLRNEIWLSHLMGDTRGETAFPHPLPVPPPSLHSPPRPYNFPQQEPTPPPPSKKSSQTAPQNTAQISDQMSHGHSLSGTSWLYYPHLCQYLPRKKCRAAPSHFDIELEVVGFQALAGVIYE